MSPVLKSRRRRQRGSTLILLMMMMPLFLIPLIGLAIDGTRLYIIQTKLSSAVDGASLGAGRLLGTNANTVEIANEFLNVNFPAGFWGTTGLNPTITFTNNLGTYTISVTATVNAPLTFMRILGTPISVVAATSTATRRQTRVMLVLDRSGSMNNTINGTNVYTSMQNSAKSFISNFTAGYDELGMVALGGSSIVAYPANWPYSTATTGVGGPDTGFATNTVTQTGPIFTAINTMVAGGGTGMAEALSMAYIELQKAHNRDLQTYGVDNNLNSIVLFTDGVPSALAVSPNDPNANTLKASGAFSYTNNKTPCTWNPGTNSTNIMKGWLAAPGSAPYSTSDWSSAGLYLLSAYTNTTHTTVSSWLANPTDDQVKSNPAATGCQSMDVGAGDTGTGSSGHNYFSTSDVWDMATIPAHDIYGNATTGAGYTHSSVIYTGTAFDNTKPGRAYHVGIACWEAVDNAGTTIRTQTNMGQIAIYTIGFTGNSGGTDAVLLQRLANTNPGDPTQPLGSYIQVSDPTQLAAAFNAIASQLLRLAR